MAAFCIGHQTLEDETVKLPRNVGHKQLNNAATQTRNCRSQNAPLPKPNNSKVSRPRTNICYLQIQMVYIPFPSFPDYPLIARGLRSLIVSCFPSVIFYTLREVIVYVLIGLISMGKPCTRLTLTIIHFPGIMTHPVTPLRVHFNLRWLCCVQLLRIFLKPVNKPHK